MFRVVVDPTNKYPNVHPYRMADSWALVLSWFRDWERTNGEITSFREVIEHNYVSKLYEIKDLSFKENKTLVSRFSEDEDLSPLLLIESQTEYLYTYSYSIIAIINKGTGEVFISRCD